MFGFTSRNSKRNRYKNNISNSSLVTKVLEIFPDACPFYVRNLCIGRSDNPFDMDHVMRPLIRGDYPRNQAYKLDDGSFEENLNVLEVIFPDADPHYLHYHAVLCLNDKNKLESFISSTLEKQDYPVITKNESARKNGQYYICNCCYDEEVKPRDLGTCESGCVFCKSCILRSVEIAYGEGKIVFNCLLGCSANFSLQTLEDALPRKFYDKIAQKSQIQEVKAAVTENLEMCPFCDFAMILAQEDKIFRCQNTDCRKTSCLLCKQLDHLPLRCDEVNKPEEIQKRTYIENKMSEALIRACYKCGLKYIKSEGCNRMKCSCGAMMCYLCFAPVQDYKHFNGPGGDNYHLCPLFSDTDELHEQNIAKGAEKARLDIFLNRHAPKTSSASKSQNGKSTPAKSTPKPSKKAAKQNAEDDPPKTHQKRKAPPRPPPPRPPLPVMQYISAIYTINNPSTQPARNNALAVPQRKAPPPPSISKNNSEAIQPTMSHRHAETQNHDRAPEEEQRRVRSHAADDDNAAPQMLHSTILPIHFEFENGADRDPVATQSQQLRLLDLEGTSSEIGLQPRETPSPVPANAKNNVNIMSETPDNTDHLHSSRVESDFDERPVPAPRRKIILPGSVENSSGVILSVSQEDNNIDLINFDSDSDETEVLPQHMEKADELPAETERITYSDVMSQRKPYTSSVENLSGKIPIPAPRYTIASHNTENNSDEVPAESHQVNNRIPLNLNHDSDKIATPRSRDLFTSEKTADEVVAISQRGLYSHPDCLPNKFDDSLQHSNSLDSFKSENGSDIVSAVPRTKSSFNPFISDKYSTIIPAVSTATPS